MPKTAKKSFVDVLIKIEDVKATNCAESKVETSIIAAGWRMIGWLGRAWYEMRRCLVVALSGGEKVAGSSLHQVHVDEEEVEGADQEEVDVEEVEVVLLDPVGENLGERQGEAENDNKLRIESRHCCLQWVAAGKNAEEVSQKRCLEVDGGGDVGIVEHLER